MNDSESRRVAYEKTIAAEAQAKYRQKVRAENQRLARERLIQRGELQATRRCEGCQELFCPQCLTDGHCANCFVKEDRA